MEVIKVVKGTVSSVSKIKNVAETLADQIKNIPIELKSIAEASKGLQEAIESGDLIEKGKACREKKLEDVKACYENAYGKIEAPAGGEKEGGQGCCITF